MTEVPGADAAVAATPGATLAATREANGLSVAQVAEQMRISPRQVEAIEADRYGELPGDVFVRGFVRNYARLLKLDPAPLLQALEPQLGGEVPLRAHEIAGTLPETVRRSHGRSWLGLIAVLVLLLAAVAAYEWWRDRAAGMGSIVPSPGSVAPQSAQPPAPPATRQESAPLSPQPLGTTEPAPAAPPPAAPTPESATGAAATAVQATSPEAGAAASGPSARLGLELVQESWIEIHDGDGQVQFSGTMPAGTTRSFDVKPPVDVVVGNASGVRITYNGKPFDVNAHAARNIARFRLE